MSDPTTCELDKLDEPDPYLVLGHLSSTVVHHVINYFSSIVSQAEIIKSQAVAAGVGQAETVTRTEAIIKAALDGSALARGLSEFSRKATAVAVTAGESGEDLVDLNQLVTARIADQRRRCGLSTEWIVNLAAAARLRGETSHLRIMLDRLLDNARESLPADGGVVTVSTLIDPMDWLVLEIRDTGSGMKPEILEHALEPFFSTKTGHLGLGLALARGIWRRHRGAFSIETTPGLGTLVRLSCPPSVPRPPQNVRPRPVGGGDADVAISPASTHGIEPT